VPDSSAPTVATTRALRVCSLYPDLMNIYADRGNLLVLERRCRWRGIGFELAARGLGESFDPEAHELFYLGGGQDRDQRLCAEDLLETKREALRAAAGRGALVLGVCGGYQLLGRSYALGEERIPGVGLLDVDTVRDDHERLIGNIAIEVSLDGERSEIEESSEIEEEAAIKSTSRILAGFENHGGRTCLGDGAHPLGRVLKGHGNDGHSGMEGARQGNTLGTYLHGPLLPKNVWFADWLIAYALRLDPDELAPLDDALEREAHLSARHAAGV
jgi:lipid II isoglutaminyl synthase (glutamine-hydrolysing)